MSPHCDHYLFTHVLKWDIIIMMLLRIVHRIRFHSIHNRVDEYAVTATTTTTAMAHRSSITHTFILDNYMVFISIRPIIAINYANYLIMTTNDIHTSIAC